MIRRVVAYSLLALLLSSTGCAYVLENPPLRHAPPEMVQVSDLPVPVGFKLDAERSWRHERSDFRRLRLIYRRRDYLGEDEARAFVAKQFEKQGWRLEFVYGWDESKLLFVREREECRVRIYEHFNDCWTEMEVVVEPTRTPEGQIVAQGPETPAATAAKPKPKPDAMK